MQPGQTITPGGTTEAPHEAQDQANNLNTEELASPAQSPASLPSASTTLPTTSLDNSDSEHAQNPDGVSWSASEYISHSKGASWFIGLGFVVVVVSVLAFIFSHDIVSPIIIGVLGIAFGIFAARTPQVLQYKVNSEGLTIEQKFYAYNKFKAFSVIEEGPIHSVILMPLQRFMPPLSLYYEPSDEDHIVDVLAEYLPFMETKRDAVDNLMHRIRF